MKRLLPAKLWADYRAHGLTPEQQHATVEGSRTCAAGCTAFAVAKKKELPSPTTDGNIPVWDFLYHHGGYDYEYLSGHWRGFDGYSPEAAHGGPREISNDRKSLYGRGYWDGVACLKAMRKLYPNANLKRSNDD
jgi:hypothetical protein